MKKKLLLIIALSGFYTAHSQILISLIFGDKLNSEYIEFGLEGGANFSYLANLDDTKMNSGFNLGFYFDFLMKKNPKWMINTGVVVKSPMGAKDLDVYSLNNETLDTSFEGGHVNRELRYFNILVLLKYRFKNNIYFKAGPELGVRAKAFDMFTKEIDGQELTYKHKIKDEVNFLDAGFTVGTGYHLMKGHGMNIGVTYYMGLVPVMKGDGPDIYNRSLYLNVGIPIGKGKAERKAAEKKAAEIEGIQTP
ncbi:outer membrane beta-barrel protein [Flavobacterium suzhouense]|uniref:Outer membrane beta-barrel protein n=1 Tax=Flavobacterium suzhouense TaxID=1529638 RepID=A0ABW5NR62_9FLAO